MPPAPQVTYVLRSSKNGIETFGLTFVFVNSSSGFADDSDAHRAHAQVIAVIAQPNY